MLRLRTTAVAVAALLCTPATAQMYDDRLLEEVHARIAPDVTLMITEDIPATLPFEQRAAASGIAVQFHYRADTPLGVFADPAARVVHVPVASLRFIGDFAIAFAWMQARGCEMEPLATYLWALLREGRELPPPLEAFAIDRDTALADSRVDRISLQLAKSAYFFIFAHEVGHVMLAHEGGASGAPSVAREVEADAFALDRFRALGTFPAGMGLYFFAARWLDPAEGADSAARTHPVSPNRLRAIAASLAEDPAAFVASEPDPEAALDFVATLASELENVSDLMADDAMLTLLPLGLERDFPLSRLTSACPV